MTMSDSRRQDVEDVPADEAGEAGDAAAEVENLRAEKQALYEKLARVQADYQNSQRRLEKEMDQRLKVAAGHLVKAFLPVVDNLERAIDVPESADTQSVLEGVRGTYEQWMDVLRKNGVERIAPEPGTPFDPTHMEALMQEPADYPTPSVTRLLQPGYEFEGRVLRPAQVAVSAPQ
jgi:molecular chaperone GrpE